MEGKKATRGIPLSHYGMLDQKCSYFIDSFWRAAREPRWPPRARVRRSYGPVEWRNLRSSAKRVPRRTGRTTMTPANEVDGTGARWWFRRFNWNVRPALKSPLLRLLSRARCLPRLSSATPFCTLSWWSPWSLLEEHHALVFFKPSHNVAPASANLLMLMSRCEIDD